MIVTSKIRLDMAKPGSANPVYAVQGDGNTRAVEITLLENGAQWQPDGDWEAAVTYRKPDGTKGLYNLLADGSPAITIDGSTATVILAAQMLTVPGTVRAAIVFNNQRLDQCTSFPFPVSVERNKLAGAEASEDYIRLKWLEDNLKIYLQKIKDSGLFDGEPGESGHTPEYGVDYATPEQITGIAQQAANLINFDANQLKDDIAEVNNTTEAPVAAGKVWTSKDDGAGWDDPQGGGSIGGLATSPVQWPEWTADEQAAARERIGIDEPYELIETFTIDEESVLYVTRETEPDGTAYNFKKVMVRITSFDTNMSGLCRIAYGHRNDSFKFDDGYDAIFYNASYNKTYVFCEKRNGLWVMEAVLTHTNGVTRSMYSEVGDYSADYNLITGVRIRYNNNFIVGTKIEIYGVRS